MLKLEIDEQARKMGLAQEGRLIAKCQFCGSDQVYDLVVKKNEQIVQRYLFHGKDFCCRGCFEQVQRLMDVCTNTAAFLLKTKLKLEALCSSRAKTQKN